MTGEEYVKYPVKIRVVGKGEATAELIRYLAPRLIDKVYRALPIIGRALVSKGFVYVETSLEASLEKPVKEVKKGDIGFWPLRNAICFFLEDMRTYTPISQLGRVLKGIELVEQVKNLDTLILERARKTPQA